MGRLYRVGEFAALTGVSIRTLHHYDEVGLLRPSAHSEAGYRLYSEEDLLCLQQVLTLRYLGFSLKQIATLVAQPDFDLVASMWRQRMALRERISELERIAGLLGELVDRRLASGEWDWNLVVQTSATVQQGLEQKGASDVQNYITPELMKQFEELGQKVTPEERQALENAWLTLLAEVRASRDLDPASPEAQALVVRWDQLYERTAGYYREYPELWQAIGKNYQAGVYANQEGAPQAEDFAFIQRVKAAPQG
jgi:DNA-binding transcriptional MerR regulator